MTGEKIIECSHLHLEDVIAAPLALHECEAELVRLEERFHDAVHVNLVAGDVSRPVRSGLHPLDGNVLEVARPAPQKYKHI